LKECEISKPHAEAKIDLKGEDKNNLHFSSSIETNGNSNITSNYKINTIGCSKFLQT
jgi:hypothetical protein